MTKFPLSAGLAEVLHCIREAGGQSIIVGGAVRDFLVDGREPKDVDIEVFGLDPDSLERALNQGTTRLQFKVDAVGKSFGVLKVTTPGWTTIRYDEDDNEVRDVTPPETFDVSLPRRENKVGRGHRGFVATPDPDMSYEDAASRRDFTMNTWPR